MRLRTSIALGMVMAFAFSAQAKLKSTLVEYDSNGTKLEGFIAYDDAGKSPKKAVILVHDWMGMGDFVKVKAIELAKKGYIAFAADIYGKGNRPKDAKQAGELAGSYKSNLPLLRERAKAAYDFVLKQKNLDSKKIYAAGFCFGGTTALEMGRAGLPLAGIASFHGGLATANTEDAKNIKGKVLVMHGALDPYVKDTEVAAFMKEMNDAKVDYRFIAYAGAVHAFTNPAAGNDISKGAAYNEKADERSFREFYSFLEEK